MENLVWGIIFIMEVMKYILAEKIFFKRDVKRKWAGFVDLSDEYQFLIISIVVVQMATKIAIESVFEADFRDCSYGFRPKRSAKQALEVVRKACNNKGYYVVDADIEKFFDNVNQDKLMKLVEQRISDRRKSMDLLTVFL